MGICGFSIAQYGVALNFRNVLCNASLHRWTAGRITPSGNIQRVSYPYVASYPEGFIHGYDGNLWFVVYRIVNGEPAGSGGYGIIDRTGTVAKAAANAVGDAVKGPDSNLWSLDQAHNAIRRVTASGTVSEFTIPTANAQALDLVIGKDGNLWFAEAQDKIARITRSGQITEFAITSPGAMIQNLIVGPDGNLWFTNTLLHRIIPCRTPLATLALRQFDLVHVRPLSRRNLVGVPTCMPQWRAERPSWLASPRLSAAAR